MRPLIVFATVLFSLALASSPAAATCTTTGSPHTRVDGVSVETKEGAAWKNGDPISIVIRISRVDDDWAFPDDGLAVVMRTDSERTKCLDVPLRKVGGSDDQAIYAGIFYPFRAAAYEAKVTIGGEAHDIAFTVGTPAFDTATSQRGAIANVERAPAPPQATAQAPSVAAPVAIPTPLLGNALVSAAVVAFASIALAFQRRRWRLMA